MRELTYPEIILYCLTILCKRNENKFVISIKLKSFCISFAFVCINRKTFVFLLSAVLNSCFLRVYLERWFFNKTGVVSESVMPSCQLRGHVAECVSDETYVQKLDRKHRIILPEYYVLHAEIWSLWILRNGLRVLFTQSLSRQIWTVIS